MKIKIFPLLALVALIMGSCTTDDTDALPCEETPTSQSTTAADTTQHHARLLMVSTLIPFDAALQTRADAWQWADSAVIYLQFHVGSSLVGGYAVYSKSSDTWDCHYNRQLDTDGQCEVYYFEEASTYNGTINYGVTLTGREPVYADTEAYYAMSGSGIVLEAALTPATSRVRFKGDSGVNINVGGLTTITRYNAWTNTFATTTNEVSLTVDSTGYTPYVYATFTNAYAHQLSISNSIDSYNLLFTKTFAANVLQKGKSGYITIPTEDTNKGWIVTGREEKMSFSVTGNGQTVQFTMIRVAPGTFEIGNYNDGNKVNNSHSVTLTKTYYMCTTEVTQALWYAVMGQKPTSDGSQWSSSYGIGNDYPAYYISYTDCQEFIMKLNSLTGRMFRMPTEAEWEFAAKGGTKSKGYKYSGSNTIGDVAWYTDNSDSKTHPAGEKLANELGLYDMSGNVLEWCADWYDSYPYTSGVQMDPTGPTTGSNRVRHGGSRVSSAPNCRTAHRSYASPDYRGYTMGFRLAL